MVVIGLTGGIGTGKSEVARVLQELGATLIDLDKLGHETYRPHTQCWRELVAAFGEDILQPSGEIDRKKLGAIVFNNPQALAKLNAIVHPQMRRMLEERIKELQSQGIRHIVVEGAIIIETGWAALTDEVWMTAAPEEMVVQRVQARNNLPAESILARIRSQMPQEERIKHAQVVIWNDGDLAQLQECTKEQWHQRMEARR